ncbi:hypothetical protein I3843_15G012000 [Carya illinoinensis]|nr:hypothetical protein I3843_15G012000 [Carya illinoinensis]
MHFSGDLLLSGTLYIYKYTHMQYTHISNTKNIIFFIARKVDFWVMEKSKSFPEYSSSYSGEFEFRERSNSYNFNGPCEKGHGFATSSDPELKRKKRIASYNVFTKEGKVKSNVRNSLKWIKGKFSDVRYGV